MVFILIFNLKKKKIIVYILLKHFQQFSRNT